MSTLDTPQGGGSSRIGGSGNPAGNPDRNPDRNPDGRPAGSGPDSPDSALAGPAAGTPEDTWLATQASPEFQSLRRALRRFAFPATAAFLAWYLLYVLMSGYARGFMDTKVLGNINVAYVFGLLQFLSTFLIAYAYSRYAEKHLDPTADAIRERLEGAGR